jgi:RHS repeat-associated protein
MAPMTSGSSPGMPPADQIPYGTAMAEGPGDVLYVVDGHDQRVAKVSSAGVASVFAGTGVAGYSGDNGPAGSAELNWPNGVATDAQGNVYISDSSNFRIREVSPDGRTIKTIAGNGTVENCTNSPDGLPATQTPINPYSVAASPSGQVYFEVNCGGYSLTVRTIAPDGTIHTLGTLSNGESGLAVDSQGDVFASANDAVYEFVGGTGSPVVVAGQPGTAGFSGDGGPPTQALLSNSAPGLAFDSAGNLYIADNGVNRRIRVVTGMGTGQAQINTVAGGGGCGCLKDGLPANQAFLDGPTAAAVDSTGNLFIGESGWYGINLESLREVKGTGFPVSGQDLIGPLFTGSDLSSEMTGGCNGSELCTQGSAGEPVNTATGDFWSRHTDLSISGRGIPLVLSRAYDAFAAASGGPPGPLGYGWSFSYGMSLAQNVSTGDVTVSQEDGAQVLFAANGSGGYTSDTRVLATLVHNSDGSWTFTRRAREKFTFNSSGQLIGEQDLNGYQTVLAYDGQGRLASVSDPAGRSLTFSYDSSNRITQVSDSSGRTVSYGYDGSGNLSTVTDVNGGKWSYGYDSGHLLTTISDPNGNTVLTNTYDTQGRVVSQKDGLGQITSFAYAPGVTTVTSPAGNVTKDFYTGTELNQETRGVGTPQQATWQYGYDGNTDGLTSVTDPNGHTSTATYNSAGDQLTSTNALGHEASYNYDSLNDLTWFQDPNGVRTTLTYDAAGNLQSIATPINSTNQTWTFTYGDSSHPGDVTKITDPNTNATTLSYDMYGDLASATDAAGDETTFAYNTIGQRTSMVSPDGNATGANPADYTTSYRYDPAGDLLSVTDPLSHTTTYGYDADQNLTSVTDADNHKTGYAYDAANQLTTVTRADGTTLTDGYDKDGNLTAQTDGAGNTTTYTYDPLDRVASMTDPLNHTTSYAYDGAGNLTSVTDPLNRVTSYGYDKANDLTSITYSDGQTPNVTYGYDNDGQRTSMTDGTGTTTYSYDALHRLTSTKDGAGHTISYGYDLANNETSITYPNGKTVTRTFDPANRLTSITDWLSDKTSFAYDPDSNLLATTFPSTTAGADSYAYNQADQLTSINMTQGQSSLATLSYTRDPLGLVTNENQTGLPGPASTSYSYTQLNQLQTAGTNSYSYDKADNPTQLDGTNGYSYDQANELTSSPAATYSYDQLGERTTATPTGGQPTGYGYNKAGELTSFTPPTATPSTFAYNGDGLRTTTTTGSTSNTITWDQTADLPLTLTDSQNSYLYGPDDLPIEQISSSGTPSYLHHDQVASTRLITSQNGNTTATFTYNPYGSLNTGTGTTTTPIGYAGQYTDPQTHLQYDRARYYDPATGQFITRDPIESLTRQPYSYAQDNPINGTDPTGLCGTGSIGDLFDCVNPTSSGNLAYKGASAVGLAKPITAVVTSAPVVDAGAGAVCLFSEGSLCAQGVEGATAIQAADTLTQGAATNFCDPGTLAGQTAGNALLLWGGAFVDAAAQLSRLGWAGKLALKAPWALLNTGYDAAQLGGR